MADSRRDNFEQLKTAVDKDIRLKNLKDRQNEERQKKLEEIKAQALAAQRFKEQKENERRKRLEDLKGKDDVRRQQVEERKKAIYQAEQDRLISILKRNQEREARIEAKKRNERSNIVFAFGSSTPRMLDPTDMTSSFWGHRKATSIQNITSSALQSRRQYERDIDSGSKKRATSAGGLERSGESSTILAPAGCASGYVGRRRTDLMPTIPSRDTSFSSSRKSLNHSPGRAYSMSRLDQLSKPRKRPELPAVVETTSYSFRSLSSPRQSSITRSMSHLAVNKTGPQQIRKPLNKSDSRSMHHLSIDGPLIIPRTTRATQLRQQKFLTSSNCSEASSRPSSSLSQQSTASVTSSVNVRYRPSTGSSRRQRPASIAITGITNDLKNITLDNKKSDSIKPPLPKTRKLINKNDKTVKNKASPTNSTPKSLMSPVSSTTTYSVVELNESAINEISQETISETIKNNCLITNNDETILQNVNTDISKEIIIEQPKDSPKIEPEKDINEKNLIIENLECLNTNNVANNTIIDLKDNSNNIEENQNIQNEDEINKIKTQQQQSQDFIDIEKKLEIDDLINISDNNKECEMSVSVSKIRINTEEEAKAALAERRRLVREEAERIAEQERLRIEEEAKAELERQKREEEQVQLLVEQQRAAEQERLEEAIKETQKREEEEKLKREEEQRLKILKEEAEKRAREEAERQKAELQERLKNEEKEREARRKRVEAIMLRTRGKNNANIALQQQNSEDKNENKPESKVNGTKSIETDNGTKNGQVLDIVDNIIPDDSVKNANTVAIDTITSTDSLNSNNTWQPQHYGQLM